MDDAASSAWHERLDPILLVAQLSNGKKLASVATVSFTTAGPDEGYAADPFATIMELTVRRCFQVDISLTLS